MRFKEIRLQGFRNFTFEKVEVDAARQFIFGANGQGKTNFLEAANLVTALRSFRTLESKALIHWDRGIREAACLYEIEHEELGEVTLEIRLSNGSKRIELDGNPVRRMRDYIGLFPTVCFNSQDIQLIRGAPSLRRRFLDLVIAGSDSGYYSELARYHQALRERNALLKKGVAGNQLRAFEKALVPSGWQVQLFRKRFIETFEDAFKQAYSHIAPIEESPGLRYEPSGKAEDEGGFARLFEQQRERDQKMKTTGIGPHRDDFSFRLLGHDSRQFASEGQQRGLVLALRLAETDWIRKKRGLVPVVLADDILGELDQTRRSGFWKAVGETYQVFATGTRLPGADDPREWKSMEIRDGKIIEQQSETKRDEHA